MSSTKRWAGTSAPRLDLLHHVTYTAYHTRRAPCFVNTTFQICNLMSLCDRFPRPSFHRVRLAHLSALGGTADSPWLRHPSAPTWDDAARTLGCVRGRPGTARREVAMRRSARERKPVCQVYVPDSPPAVVRRKRKAKLAPAGRVAKRKKQRSGRARPPKKFPAGPFPLGALQDGLKAAAGEFKLSKTILQAVMRARPKPKAFRLLRRNFCRDGHVRQKFLTPLPEGDWPTCGCSAGVGACGPLSNCANRSLFMECLDGKCTAGGACGNGALQRRQFPLRRCTTAESAVSACALSPILGRGLSWRSTSAR